MILVLAGLFWPLRPCSALRILNLVDPNPNLTSLANNSPQISATFTQLPADLRFVLRDPLRNMQPLGIEHLVPFPSLEPGPPELVHVFVASIDLAFPARYFAHLHATQNPEKSTEFALPESITFPRAGRYRLQIMANLLNPQTPMWEDPSQLTRNREVELVQIGPGGEIWGRMESGAGTMLGDGVEVVVLGTNGEENGKENGAKGDQMDVKVVVKGEGEEHSWVDFEKSLVETNGSTSYSASASWVDRTPTDLNAIADRCQVLLVTFTEQNNGKKKAVMDFVASKSFSLRRSLSSNPKPTTFFSLLQPLASLISTPSRLFTSPSSPKTPFRTLMPHLDSKAQLSWETAGCPISATATSFKSWSFTLFFSFCEMTS